MKKTVFLVRTRAFDALVQNLCSALTDAGAKDVVIVADERHGPVETAPYPKIALTEELVRSIGLAGLPANWGWFCGDVCLYAARQARPDAKRFVMVESDVALTGKAAAQLVKAMSAASADLVAPRLSAGPAIKRHSRGLEALGRDPLWGCLFPLVSASARGVDAMLDLRRKSLSLGVADQTNDEAILAGAAQARPLTFQAAEDLLGEVMDPACFDTNPPHLAEGLAREEQRDRIFHPVVALATVLDRIAGGEKAYTRHRLRHVLARALPDEARQITAALRSVTGPAVVPRPSRVKDRRTARLGFLADALRPETAIRVLDVGANPLIEGDAPYAALLTQGLAQVWGFEPQPEALAALQARKSGAETYLPYALGDGSARTLHVYKSQGFTSLFRIDEASARHCRFGDGTMQTGEASVATHRLDALDEVPEVDLVKIDVQGAEAIILENGRAKLRGALAVVTEARLFPLYVAEPRFGALDGVLHDQGFEFLRFLTMKHVGLSRRHRKILNRGELSQAVDGDAVYLRDLRQIASLSDDALVKLALIADSVIDNADLTLRLLEELEDRGRIDGKVLRGYIALLPATKLRSPTA